MKAIMISIQSKWVAKILNGEKTIEIRKTMPKCDLPINVYIYCTKEEKLYDDYPNMANGRFKFNKVYQGEDNLSGKVVAKFTLNKVEEIRFDDKEVQRKACLTEDELFDYLFVNEPYHEDMKKGYAWHIDKLEIFGKPKELNNFSIRYSKGDIKFVGAKGKMLAYKTLTKAPQSWCYVEVNEND